MKNKPSYALTSVDNALLLLQLLRDQGSVRVSEAADELGIARSTAHRLLSMLVYRDFAIQDDRKMYVPGPALAASQVVGRPLQQLRRTLHPHMDTLCERAQETVNLSVRIGTQTRFLASVESTQVLHVGDRRGTILPAHRASGGKALLAELDDDQLDRLYHQGGSPADEGAGEVAPLSGKDWKALVRELKSIRDHGYALNLGDTETGVSAVGMCVHDASGAAVGALSISAPATRFETARIPHLVRELSTTVSAAESDLRALPQM